MCTVGVPQGTVLGNIPFKAHIRIKMVHISSFWKGTNPVTTFVPFSKSALYMDKITQANNVLQGNYWLNYRVIYSLLCFIIYSCPLKNMLEKEYLHTSRPTKANIQYKSVDQTQNRQQHMLLLVVNTFSGAWIQAPLNLSITGHVSVDARPVETTHKTNDVNVFANTLYLSLRINTRICPRSPPCATITAVSSPSADPAWGYTAFITSRSEETS